MPDPKTISKAPKTRRASPVKKTAKKVEEVASPENVLSSDRFRTPCFYRNREMTFAQFPGSDLSGSDFFGTRLGHANFRGSRLVGVVFTNADLRNADLRGTDLTDASFGETLVRGLQLQDATGLNPGLLTDLERRGAIVRDSAVPPQQKLA